MIRTDGVLADSSVFRVEALLRVAAAGVVAGGERSVDAAVAAEVRVEITLVGVWGEDGRGEREREDGGNANSNSIQRDSRGSNPFRTDAVPLRVELPAFVAATLKRFGERPRDTEFGAVVFVGRGWGGVKTVAADVWR